jgi:hypothetical protein
MKRVRTFQTVAVNPREGVEPTQVGKVDRLKGQEVFRLRLRECGQAIGH